MPYIKITGAETGNNKGSCKALVRYLEKENKPKTLEERELFFSHNRDFVTSRVVINHIDSNRACLGKQDAKFYMVTINPSEKELAFMANDKQKLKEYTRDVMELYAKNFNKGLEGKDLVYYAKLEDNRYYKGSDPEVKDRQAKQGEIKDGYNMHIHVIVSRKDHSNKIKLSPTTNHRSTSKGPIKGGFDRVNFKQQCEEKFDQTLKYQRQLEEQFKYHNTLKNGSEIVKQDLKYQQLDLNHHNYSEQRGKERKATNQLEI
jgi:hypothetical protein